ncbi:hypothetical protein ACQUW5_10320 [Legionella sp. CNM-1927-20]|uniref:hypothetical protein n=1 Tax=Legionella sp. CNM-1927-20 TaxID=3422221 RepID=UPI00403AE5AF
MSSPRRWGSIHQLVLRLIFRWVPACARKTFIIHATMPSRAGGKLFYNQFYFTFTGSIFAAWEWRLKAAVDLISKIDELNYI